MKRILLLTIIIPGVISISNAQTWIVLSSGTTENLFGVFATSPDDVHATGNNGVVLSSTNQGANWNVQYAGTCNYRSIYFSSPTTGFVAGGLPTPSFLSYIYKTSNSGTSWTSQLSVSPNGLYGIHFPDATHGYAVGGSPNSLMYKSTDSGTSWTSLTLGVSTALLSVFFTAADTGYVVGANGNILKTLNGGGSWNTQLSGTTNILTSVYFTDTYTGYAVGSSGTVVKTTNGGTTWTLIPILGFTTNLNAVYFFNADHGFAVGDNGAIIETDDGGTTWTQYLGISAESLRSIHFPDQNTGYVCGYYGTLLKYTNDIGYEEKENTYRCTVYPNPAAGTITIAAPLQSEIEILNPEGQCMKQTLAHNNTTTLDISGFAPGIYFAKVKSGEGVVVKKFIKQ